MAKFEERNRTSARRSSWDELDAWVMEEQEAVTRLSRQRSQRPGQAKADCASQEEGKIIDARRWPKGSVSKRAQTEQRASAIDANPSAEGLFTSEEEAFITQTVAWLKDRPNVDVLLEEIWHLALGEPTETPDGDHAVDGQFDANASGSEFQNGTDRENDYRESSEGPSVP